MNNEFGMTQIREKLFDLQDKKYATFQSKLTPTITKGKFIGVRIPDAHKFAKQLATENKADNFMHALPHFYFDENILHALLISEIKAYEACVKAIDEFLPYVDNWAVCDAISPKIFKKHKNKLIEKIKDWTNYNATYTCRFGIKMLMSHFLDADFHPEYLQIPASVYSGEYYVNMMIAWFFATALAKQWEASILYLTEKKLQPWVHKKTIQKACESKRISKKQKTFLKQLR